MNNWYTHEEIKFKLLMRRHMQDHIIWLKSYMVSLLADLPDLVYVEDRLLRNQNSIANCMREFFGDVVIDHLIELRKEHTTLIMDMLKATKTGDTINMSTIEANLVTNTENIATLLSIANPLYSREELIDIFNTHLILIKYEFIARMSGDYNADIVYFDMSIHQATTMADYFTSGIIERFFKQEMMGQYQIQPEQQSLSQEQFQGQIQEQEQFREQVQGQQEQYTDNQNNIDQLLHYQQE